MASRAGCQKGFGCNARLKIQRRKLEIEWKESVASRNEHEIKVSSKSVMLISYCSVNVLFYLLWACVHVSSLFLIALLLNSALPSADIIQSHLSSSWRFSLVFYLQKISVKPQPRLISSCWLMDPGVSAAWTSKPSGLLSVAWWASLTLAPTRFKSASLLCFCLLHVFRFT